MKMHAKAALSLRQRGRMVLPVEWVARHRCEGGSNARRVVSVSLNPIEGRERRGRRENRARRSGAG